MALTKADRKFIMKAITAATDAQKNTGKIDKRVKRLEGILLKDSGKELPTAAEMTPEGDSKVSIEEVQDKVDVEFFNDRGIPKQHQVIMVETLYRELKDMCTENGISRIYFDIRG